MATIKSVAIAKASKVYRYDSKAICGFVIGEDAAKQTLIEAISEANHASPALMHDVQAARDWLRECKALRKAQQTLRFPEFDLKAQAWHLALVKGTTSKREAKAKGVLLIDKAQATANGTHRQYWSRLLIDAGVKPVNKRKGGKKIGKKLIFATPAKAASYFQDVAALMVKTVQANKRGGSISAKAVSVYAKAVSDFTLACARAAKLIKK